MRSLASCALAVLLFAGLASAEPIAIEVAPIPFNVEKPGQADIGKLRFMGGVRLASRERSFGGYSGMALGDAGRRLVAVSDLGHWLTLTLTFDAEGRLKGAGSAEIAPMLGPDGNAIAANKSLSDAEALRRDADGSLLVAFERQHRLWRYGDAGAKAVEVQAPIGLQALGNNDGIESLALLKDGRLLLIEEGPEGSNADLRAWAGRDGEWQEMSYRRHGLFRPTDAVTLPDGDVLVLERRFTVIGGVAARLLRIPQMQIKAGATLIGTEMAELVPPVTVDNMEALDIVVDAGGRIQVFILSDDNQNPLQRTILMQFELLP